MQLNTCLWSGHGDQTRAQAQDATLRGLLGSGNLPPHTWWSAPQAELPPPPPLSFRPPYSWQSWVHLGAPFPRGRSMNFLSEGSPTTPSTPVTVPGSRRVKASPSSSDPGAPERAEENENCWGRVHAPEEGVLLPIHPGVKGQSRIVTERRDDDGEHESQTHKSGWKHNLWGDIRGTCGTTPAVSAPQSSCSLITGPWWRRSVFRGT